MPCIFGFGFHEWFSPSDLTHVKKSDILRDLPICQLCKLKLENEYKNSVGERIQSTTINGFLNIHIEERLRNLSHVWESESDMTEKQMEKFNIIYDGFMVYKEIDLEIATVF